VLSYQSCSLKFESWSSFVCSLDLTTHSERLMVKAFLTFCNIRTQQNKYEISEDKFNTFILRTDFIKWDVIQNRLGRFSTLYRPTIDKEVLADYSMREDCNHRLLRVVENLLEGDRAQTKQPSLQFAWTYLQYLVCRRKCVAVQKELLGRMGHFSEK
jgi:hypothetical protein